MAEGGRVLFDASAYMLFEASGDSEAPQYFDGGAFVEIESDAADAAADDDAQSCSYGSLYDGGSVHEVEYSGGDDNFRGADFDDDCSGEEEDDSSGGGYSEEEDGVVDQCRRIGKTAAAAKEKPKKSRACEDSNVKMMNEMEGDKQFWEACLAS